MPPVTRQVTKPYTAADLGRELRGLEERWRMSTADFLVRWRAGELDEREFDFARWDVVASELAETTEGER